MAPSPASEATPLLAKPAPAKPASSRGLFSPLSRLLLTTLLLSISFVLTATSLLYGFREMSCEEYYRDGRHEWRGGEDEDRCAVREVEGMTAREVSYMVTLTTIAGVLNLLTTGVLTRRYGTWSMFRGGLLGIRVIQITQLITILGGGAGYILCANTYAAALVTPEERTATFGRLQGVQMLGTAVGLSVGGWMGEKWGLASPFILAFCFLVCSTILSGCFLPYIPPTAADESGLTKSSGAFSGFLAPLKIFAPRKVEKEDGSSSRWYGLTLIGTGSFLGVLATACIQILLQLISTNAFGFKPTANGNLMSLVALSRAGFLTLLFPRIIAAGRSWYTPASSSPPPVSALACATPPRQPEPAPPDDPAQTLSDLPTTFRDLEPVSPLLQTDSVQEPAKLPSATDEPHGSRFDLTFLRGSMVVDALLTGCVGFAREGWHMYLAALVLPLASGTAPACKGVVLDMVEPAEQADALQGIALVETLASVITVSMFGAIFAELSERGRGFDVFFLNAAVALVAAAILQFVRFPPKRESTVRHRYGN
ncbi:hypothetical protein JCM5296_002721 [Sporobolomyces johnsonii]